jgi:hypothetical protein
MLKTVEELKAQKEKHGYIGWNIHECSICHYMCGFVFQKDGDEVAYDNGCRCSMQPMRPSSWEEVAEHYNRNQRENNKTISDEALEEMEMFWQFNKKTDG